MQYFGFDRPSFAFKNYGFGSSESSEFSPLDLFAGGKQGVWYDPSDKSTLFQDAAGTVPVTADGDPVGLILDKSQGLELGATKTANWVSDFVFSDGTVATSKTVDRVSGTTSTSSNVLGYFSITNIVNGGFYELTLTSHNTNNITLASLGDTGLAAAYSRQTGARTRYFQATKDSASLIIQVRSAGAGESLDFGSITIRQLKGNHATQSVSAARPTYKKDSTKAWLYHDKVDDRMFVALPAMTATVVTATDDGVTINYPVSIPSGNYALTNNSTLGRDYGRLIIDKELSASEQAQVTAYFNAKRGV